MILILLFDCAEALENIPVTLSQIHIAANTESHILMAR